MRRAPLSPIFCLTTFGVAAFLFPFSGCASPEKKATAPAHVHIGQVALVNEEKRFVLIDLGSNLYLPEPGLVLTSDNGAGGVAHLKTTPEQKRPFVAADIIDGMPATGDQVDR